jgi:sterol desaturase/sphingolipid hydroxylase (fatty acid hydroxylase superfamily)
MNPAYPLPVESSRVALGIRAKLARFTEAHPAGPNLFALAGLALIAYYLVPITSPAAGVERGRVVDTIGAVTGSAALTEWASWLRAAYHAALPEGVRFFLAPLLNPALYMLVPFLWLLEYLFPADPQQPILTKSLYQDLFWFVLKLPTEILIIGTCLGLVEGFYASNLSFLTVAGTTQWPAYLQILAALFVGEFAFWFSHFVRHKVAAFWTFHAVHHSQKQMNFATEDRTHFADQLITNLVVLLPLLMFQVGNLQAVAILVIYRSIHLRFVHANVKLNLGWLGWIVASPQFHRVHHSVERGHSDKNFGALLSVFDYAFGTAHPSRTVYPPTGIDDAAFPDEARFSVRQLPLNWLRQTVYPFSSLWKR